VYTAQVAGTAGRAPLLEPSSAFTVLSREPQSFYLEAQNFNSRHCSHRGSLYKPCLSYLHPCLWWEVSFEAGCSQQKVEPPPKKRKKKEMNWWCGLRALRKGETSVRLTGYMKWGLCVWGFSVPVLSIPTPNPLSESEIICFFSPLTPFQVDRADNCPLSHTHPRSSFLSDGQWGVVGQTNWDAKLHPNRTLVRYPCPSYSLWLNDVMWKMIKKNKSVEMPWVLAFYSVHGTAWCIEECSSPSGAQIMECQVPCVIWCNIYSLQSFCML
jgi:hypothetical protein